jgi:hypothetical protein
MSSSSFFFSLIICLLVISCANNSSELKNEKNVFFVKTKPYQRKSNPCPDEMGSCAEINFKIPFIENHEYAGLINQEILKELEVIMENFSPPLKSLQDITSKIDSFISQHKSFSKEVDFPQNWTFNLHFELLENNGNSLSILLNTDRYTGGAHPFNSIRILSFNTKNGKRNLISSFIKDEQKLKELIIKEVRRKRNISDSVNLTEEGFYANEWPLPENFALLSQGLYIVYNAYEIGPYVLGSTEILIPIEEIKPLLKD